MIVHCVAGSHLFGTETENSDMDYKGVYLPTAKEILLGNYLESKAHTTGDPHGKNTKNDVDTEFYSLKKFLKMIKNGDTSALELLFTPEDKIISKSEEWDYILSRKDQLLSSRVQAMIGYARQQANKYGIKGSRMGELGNILDFFKLLNKKLDFPNAKLKHGWEDITVALKDYTFVHFIELDTSFNGVTKKEPAIEILGKKFGEHTPLNLVCKNLSDTYKNYGQRAREAKNNNGVDFKALSHAVRVSIQGIDLMKYGVFHLPHTKDNLNLIKDIKLGRIHFEKVSEIITDLLAELEEARTKSSLQDEVPDSVIEEIMIELHSRQLGLDKHPSFG